MAKDKFMFENKEIDLKNGKSACIQLVKTNDGYNLIASANKDGIVAKCLFDICTREVLQMKNANIKANINRYLIKEKSILNGEIYSKIVDKNYIIKNNIPFGEETNVCRLKQIEILNEEYANIGIGSYLIKCAETFALEKGCYMIYGFFYPHGNLWYATQNFYKKNGFYLVKDENNMINVKKIIDGRLNIKSI